MGAGVIDSTGTIHKPAGSPDGGQFAGKVNTAPAETLTGGGSTVLARYYDTLEEKMQAIEAELTRGVEELKDDENWRRHLDVMSQFHRYSFNNQLLIQLQCPEATRVAGKKVWSSLGRKKRPGVRGISILAPVAVRVRSKSGDEETDEDGRPKTKVVRFTSTTVYDVSQTDGEPLPEIWRELSEEPPAGYVEDLEAAIRAHGFEVVYEKTGSAARGYTSPARKAVVIAPDLSPGSKATTLAHELGHIACGHTDRLDEYHTGHGGSRGEMEVEAESFGYVLSRMNGMDMETKPASEYVANWQRYDTDALKRVGMSVQRAVKSTIEKSPWANVIDA